MSFNLLAEGDLDLFELGRGAQRYAPLELFPVPADSPGPGLAAGDPLQVEPDALGIAIRSRDCGPEAVAALQALVRALWNEGARVYNLHSGEEVATPQALEEIARQVGG